MKISQTFLLGLLFPALCFIPRISADALQDRILPLREQAELVDRILQERLDTIIPLIMRREGIEAWVIIGREYNEDPVLKTMLPATWLNARRRTVLMFIDQGDTDDIKRMAVSRYAVGDLFPGVWNPEEEPDQYTRIAQLLEEYDPTSIALNFSENYAHADGLSYSEQQQFELALPEDLRSRITSGEKLSVGWLETRTASEIEIYRDVMSIALEIIKEGFSNEAVNPGQTTERDLEWWFRQRVNDLGLQTWFHPSISIDRSDSSLAYIDENDLDKQLIYPGDHLHVDFGISYLNLQTDTQQNAYVLRDGETEAPTALQMALRGGNQLQDILTGNFQIGRTGNEILQRTRSQAITAGIGPIIYTHPIGLHGHAAGTTIGMWDKQEGVPGSGDYPMHANTAYSIELTAEIEASDWSVEPIAMKLEEDGFYDGEKFEYILPRQTQHHLIWPN